MPDLGDITLRLSADLGDVIGQLASFSDTLRSTLAAPDMSGFTGAFDAAGQSVAMLSGDAQAAASGITAAFANVDIATPDISPITNAFDQIDQEAIQTGKAVDELGAAVAGFLESGQAATMAEALAMALGQLDQSAVAADAALPGVANAIEGIGSAAASAEGQLSLFDQATQVPYADAAGQLNLFATQLEPIAGAAQSAAEAAAALGDAVGGAGKDASAAAGMLAGYGDAALGLMQAQRDADAELANAQQALAQIQAAYSLGEASANDLARAEQAVASAAAEANPALKDSGDAANQASTGLGEMAAQLAAIGAALAVTAGLKEFASEALEAYANVQLASVSLTALTGSATGATAAIDGLRDLAIDKALSFDSLVSAQQRMTALGLSADQIKANLNAAADSARATGAAFDSVAQKLANIEESGNATGKSLVSLGLSLGDLAKAMNETGVATGVTAEAAAKAFKALDQADRVTVLTDALSKFSGVADAAAATLSGQFTNLGTQVEFILEQVGESLAPLAAQLTAFIGSEVLPTVKGIVDAFTSLPAPLQEAALAFAAVVAAIVPLAAAGGAIALALEGLGTLLPSITGLLETFGLAASSAAVEESAAAAATTALGESAAVAEVGLTALGGVVAIGLVAGIAAAVAGFSDLKAAMADTEAAAAKTNDAFLKWLATLGTAAESMQDIQAAQDKIKQALDAGALSAAQATTLLKGLEQATRDLKKAQDEAVGSEFNKYLSDIGISVTVLGQSMSVAQATTEASSISMGRLRDSVGGAQEKLVAAVQAYNAIRDAGGDLTKASLDVANAQDAVSKATAQLNSNLTALAPVVTNVHAATKDFVDTSGLFVSAEQAMADKSDAAQTKISLLAGQLINAQRNLSLASEAMKAGAQDATSLEQAEGKVAKALDTVTAAQNNLNKAVGEAPKVSFISPEALKNLQAVPVEIQKIIEAADQAPQAITPINKAIADLGMNAKNAKPDVDTLLTDLKTLEADGGTSWASMVTGVETFGKAVSQLAKVDLPGAVHAEGEFTQSLIDSDAPTSMIVTSLGVYQGYIQKLAKEDLPSAVQEQGLYIDQLRQIGAPISEIVKATEEWDKMQIQLAEDSGTSASKFIINLDLMKQHTMDLHDSFANLGGNLFTGVLKVWDDAFTSLGNHLTDAITGAKSWHDAFQGFLQDMEKEITNVFVGVVLKGLRSELDSLLGSLFPSLNAAITGTGGAIGGLAGAAKTATGSVAAVGEAATDAFPSISKAGGAAGGLASGAGAAASSLTGMVTAISSVVGALAGIAGDILQAHANNLLGEIEINTRSAFNEISNARTDAWAQYNGTFQRLGDIWGTLQAMGGADAGNDAAKNTIAALDSIGQTLLDIDTNIYNVLTTLQGGIGTSGKSTGTADLGGQSLATLGSMLTALNGIWGDENLVVQGLQNIAIDIQALAAQSNAGASDFKNLFTNAQTTTAGQIATVTKQISDNNAQIALALASNNNALAKSLGDQNTTLQAQLAALQRLQDYGSAEASAAADARDAAIKQAAAAQSVAEKIAALQAEAKADAALAIAEQKIGNQTAADAAAKAAADIQAQIAALLGPLSNIDSNTAGLAAAITAIGGRGSGEPSQEATPVAGTTETGRGGASGTGTTGGIPTGRAPQKSFDLGGFVHQDMLASLHANEWVIPPAPATISLPPDVLSRINMPDASSVMNIASAGTSLVGSPQALANSSTHITSITIQGGVHAHGVQDPKGFMDGVIADAKLRSGKTVPYSN